MRKIACCFIVFLQLTAFLPIVQSAAAATNVTEYNYIEDFDDYVIGALPSGEAWIPAGTVDAQVKEESGNRFIQLRNTNGTGSSTLSMTLPDISGRIVVDYDVRVNDSQYQQIPSIEGTLAGGGKAIAALAVADSGKLWLNNEAIAPELISNQWYHYRLVLHTDTDRIDLFRDGSLLVSGKKLFNNANMDSLNKIIFKVKSNTSSRLDFDNVSIHTLPEQTGGDHFFLRAGSFADEFGTWKLSSYTGSFDNVVLAGTTESLPENTEPAKAEVTINNPGIYRIWVRSADFAANQPGTRYFNVKLGDGLYDHRFGKHGSNGFRWEDGGTVQLPAGNLEIKLEDTSAFFARFDSLFITSDVNMVPPDKYEQMLAIGNVIAAANSSPFAELLDFPAWANASEPPVATRQLDNGKIRITFYQIDSMEGQAIQQKVELNQNGNWVTVQERGNDFGYLTLFADDSAITNYYFYGTPVWTQSVDYNGTLHSFETGDVFRSGLPAWIIPSSISMPDSKTAVLHGGNEFAELTVTWKLDDGDLEPKVTSQLKAKKDGYLTLGMFNGKEKPIQNIDYLLAPLQFVNKFLPPISALVSEVTSTNASSMMTVNDLNSPLGASTYGITVDPESIPYRWAYTDNQKFGLGIRGQSGGVQPYLFAPLLGMPDSHMSVDQTYEIAYRPTYRFGDWYETYRHVVTDLFQTRDIRENYYSSVTDTVFQLHDLILNDRYSGWSDIAKGFANMEVKNQFKQPSPLVMMQEYLLTEDSEFYEQRTIPSMAYLLTRKREGFALPGSTEPVIPIGESTALYGSGIFSGIYRMTQGLVPAFRQIGIEGPVKSSQTGQIPALLDKVYRYRDTGLQADLTAAKNEADAYMQTKVFGGRYTDPNGGFYALDAFPNLSGLLDLYEMTGESAYLDGAAESARQLLTSTWTQPLVPEGPISIDADWIRDRGFWSDDWANQTYYWNGLTRHRLGNVNPYDNGYNGSNGPADNIGDLADETVPAWLTSRNGWSVEGAGSYFTQDSTNVTMTNWAADLLRLAEYSGDSLFETVSRNEIIGRAANYPGYYVGKDMTNYMKEDYPYAGPDTTNIYYHHIPVYLGMLEDYLFTQAWKWSNRQIEFPSVRQYGYVWFDNRIYGAAPGSFFGEEGMWPWLKKGLVTTNNIQTDWIAARKDGVFGVALMNQSDQASTVQITLGEEVVGSDSYSGTAKVQFVGQNEMLIPIVNGQFTVTIPAKGLVAATVYDVPVQAPGFGAVDTSLSYAEPIGQTIANPVSEQDFGQGYVLQVDPSSYYAYVFVPHTDSQIRKAVLHYKTGSGTWQTKEKLEYPFEFIEKVDDPGLSFDYYVEVTDLQQNVIRSTDKTLKPTVMLNADKIAPVSSPALYPATPNGANGWYTSEVSVTLATYDDMSGVDKLEYRINNGNWTVYDGVPLIFDAEGIHVLEYRGIDKAGNEEPVKSTVIKIDKTPPQVAIALDHTVLSPPNHTMIPIQATLAKSDGTSGIASVVLQSIASNEADNGTGDGNTSNDIQDAEFGTEDTSFSLRAERSGGGNGRIYTVTYEATDNAGLTAAAIVEVTVPK